MPSRRNNRRTTLGPVSMNYNEHDVSPSRNSRGNRVSMGGGTVKKPARSRQSMLPRVSGSGGGRFSDSMPSSPSDKSTASISRRKTVAADPHRRQSTLPPQTVVKHDPRPIADKDFQNACVKQLLEYLSNNGYEYHLTHKSLSRPSAKDFANIVTFLLRKIDPTFQRDITVKFEDEIVMNFKAMGYPYPLSKTALIAAGSPHTWPSLLAALTWLMEHLMQIPLLMQPLINTGPDVQMNSMEELEAITETRFIEFMHDTYRYGFLRSDPEMVELANLEFAEQIERDNLVFENEIERVTELNEIIVEKIDHLKKDQDVLPEMAEKRENLALDLEQFHDLVRQMNEHKDALKSKVEERTIQLAETNEELKEKTDKIESLKEQIQNQELSIDDVRKMKAEQARLKEALEKAVNLKQYNKETLWKLNSELTELYEELDGHVKKYSDLVSELARSVDTTGINLKITVDRTVEAYTNQSSLLGLDLGDVRQYLSDLKQIQSGSLLEKKKAFQEALDSVEESLKANTEAEDRLKIIQDKEKKCEETLESENQQRDATLAVREREVHSFKEKADSLRSPVATERMILLQRQLDELESLQRKHDEETLLMQEAVEKEINAAIQAIVSHNAELQRKFADLEAYAQQKKQSLCGVKAQDSNRTAQFTN